MTILYLNDTQVYPDSQQSIKITKENPYFTTSDSYTLDVTLPMDIFENRVFFDNIQLIEKKKKAKKLSCKLFVDNELLICGSAKVTQVTEKEVKVQLLGGNSELKFLGEDGNEYIDEMNLPQVGEEDENIPDGYKSGVYCIGLQAYDETYDRVANRRYQILTIPVNVNTVKGIALQPNLIMTMYQVLKKCGYECDIPFYNEPWKNVFIASAKQTDNVAHALPHWKVKEFVDEFCRFFNVTLVTDQLTKTAKFVDNSDFFGRDREAVIDPIDEYTVEMNEESDDTSLASSNIEFDMSSSPSHDYDVIPENVRENAKRRIFYTFEEAVGVFNSMAASERMKYIYETPVGKFAGWTHDYGDVDESEEKVVFTQIDVFGPLIRSKDNSTISLKICPVAITEEPLARIYAPLYRDGIPLYCRSMSLENQTGNEKFNEEEEQDESVVSDDPASIQEYIEGDVQIDKVEKEDRMQVFFHDHVLQQTYAKDNAYSRIDPPAIYMPFTDFKYKRTHGGATHRPWSFSLNPTDATYYLGQRHVQSYTFNMKAKLCFKFLAKQIPDPTKVFIIRNKRYGCEKIEAQVDNEGMQQLMTGYFYEMT